MSRSDFEDRATLSLKESATRVDRRPKRWRDLETTSVIANGVPDGRTDKSLPTKRRQ
jgi:hypothetical protein